jgi:hypothetical protein
VRYQFQTYCLPKVNNCKVKGLTGKSKPIGFRV